MILRFEIANFRSFNEPTAMLLSAGREKLQPFHGAVVKSLHGRLVLQVSRVEETGEPICPNYKSYWLKAT